MKPILISHCRRKIGIGGEDIALDRIAEASSHVNLQIYEAPNNQIFGLIKFIFSPKYFFKVFRSRRARHIFCNPFPEISIFSILLLGLARIPLRYYIHDFSASCPANKHFAGGVECFKSLSGRGCLRYKCVATHRHLYLSIFRNYLFWEVFKLSSRNKVYFVAPFQKSLALATGLRPSQGLVVGNI